MEAPDDILTIRDPRSGATVQMTRANWDLSPPESRAMFEVVNAENGPAFHQRTPAVQVPSWDQMPPSPGPMSPNEVTMAPPAEGPVSAWAGPLMMKQAPADMPMGDGPEFQPRRTMGEGFDPYPSVRMTEQFEPIPRPAPMPQGQPVLPDLQAGVAAQQPAYDPFPVAGRMANWGIPYESILQAMKELGMAPEEAA